MTRQGRALPTAVARNYYRRYFSLLSFQPRYFLFRAFFSFRLFTWFFFFFSPVDNIPSDVNFSGCRVDPSRMRRFKLVKRVKQIDPSNDLETLLCNTIK